MAESTSYDVFLSHNSADKPAVEVLAEHLEDKAKLRPFLDKWHLIPGESWLESLEKALEQSKTCAVFLGPNGVGPWENKEMQSYLIKSVSDRKLRIIPVLLPSATAKDSSALPMFLRDTNWVDFSSGLDNEEAFHLLVSGIRGIPPGRRTPPVLPSGSLYVRKSTREMMDATLKKHSLDISNYLKSPGLTLRSLAKRCKLLYPHLAIPEIRFRLKEARAVVFEEKYSGYSEDEDERFLQYENWEQEFQRLLIDIGIKDFSIIQAISVGIGNGREHPSFYHDFQSLIGVDISRRSLELAKRFIPNMKGIQVEAENLEGVESISHDLYISLRTYQSTFFDIEESLFEAYRVLRPGGYCVISIPYVFYKDGEIRKGLIRPGTKNELDIDLPYTLADRIRRGLNQLDFDSAGLRTGIFEIYVYGRKGQ